MDFFFLFQYTGGLKCCDLVHYNTEVGGIKYLNHDVLVPPAK